MLMGAYYQERYISSEERKEIASRKKHLATCENNRKKRKSKRKN